MLFRSNSHRFNTRKVICWTLWFLYCWYMLPWCDVGTWPSWLCCHCFVHERNTRFLMLNLHCLFTFNRILYMEHINRLQFSRITSVIAFIIFHLNILFIVLRFSLCFILREFLLFVILIWLTFIIIPTDILSDSFHLLLLGLTRHLVK